MTKTSKKICLFIISVLVVAFLVALIPSNTVSYSSDELDPVLSQADPIQKPIETPKVERKYEYIPEGTPDKVVAILNDLIKCESRGNQTALNKVDRDGTASFGLLQFKPDTFYGVLKQYIDPTITRDEAVALIYNGDIQVRAFIVWYGNGKPVEWWAQQFPACSKLYGYWL